MGCKLDDFKVDAVYKNDELTKDSFNFTELTGKKTRHSKGYFGQGVVITSLDTGVNMHPEFGDRLLPGKNCITNYGNTSYADDNGHGTHTSGTMIGGLRCGIAPKAKILPIKVLRADGSGEWNDIIKGLDYARTWRGPKGEKVKIINMSLSGGERDISESEKIALEKAIDACVAVGIIPVCSAGNTGNNEKRYPACLPNVITVGAVDWDKMQAMFATEGNNIDVTQIGTKVISACRDGEYIEMSGTSMSTPMVSGGIALLISEYIDRWHEDPTFDTVYKMVIRSSKDLFTKGFDTKSGNGFFTLQPLQLKIKVEHGSCVAYVNDVRVVMPVPVEMKGDGHTTIHLRTIMEAMGAQTKWYPQTGEHNTQAEFEV